MSAGAVPEDSGQFEHCADSSPLLGQTGRSHLCTVTCESGLYLCPIADLTSIDQWSWGCRGRYPSDGTSSLSKVSFGYQPAEGTGPLLNVRGGDRYVYGAHFARGSTAGQRNTCDYAHLGTYTGPRSVANVDPGANSANAVAEPVEEEAAYAYHDNLPWVQGATPAFGPGGYSLKTREKSDGEIRLRVVYLGVQDMSNNDTPCTASTGESITMTWDDQVTMTAVLRRDAASVFNGSACKFPVNLTLNAGLGNMTVDFP